ncbi:MAG: hypothetical protein ACLUVC_06455 [Longibaculum sp.]
MKKENGKIKKLLLLGGLAILLTIGIATYARYSSSVTGTGTANVALYTNDATFTIPEDSIPSQPGETSTIDFSVTNTKENKTAEVAQTYQFYIETAGNLPFTFALSNDEGSSWKSANGNETTEFNPVPELGLNSEEHQWKLKMTWDKSENSDKYVDELDYVKIKVKMQQKIQ